MPAYGSIDPAYAGLLITGHDFVESGICDAVAGIAFGAPVFAVEGEDQRLYPSKTGAATFVLSAAFVTGNTIAGTINGVSYSQAFVTDDATTFAALVAQIDGLANTEATGNFATRTINIINQNGAASATGTVTGGASQATVTVTTSAGNHLVGVSLHTHKEYAGVGTYAQGEVVGYLRSGLVWVQTNAAVLANQPAYWDATNKFWTNVSSGNFQTPYYFRSSAASGGYAILDVSKSPAALVG